MFQNAKTQSVPRSVVPVNLLLIYMLTLTVIFTDRIVRELCSADR